MKWNVLFGSLVLTMGLCTQGFGGLFDRMLGVSGCQNGSCCEASCGVAAATCCDDGCSDCCDTGCDTCCETDDPCGCGRWRGPFSHLWKSGCNDCCDDGCDSKPAFFGKRGCCDNVCPDCSEGNPCGQCAPCGECDPCNRGWGLGRNWGSGCGCRKSLWSGGLLDGLFGRSGCGCGSSSCCDSGGFWNNSCCEPTCGCAANSNTGGDDSMPPAPVVDPSAYQTAGKLEVINASHTTSFGRWSKR